MALISEQTSSLKKKITSLITAGALIITGSAGIAHLSKKNDNKNVDISTTTSVSTTVTGSPVVKDELFKQLKLTANFDINDKAAVKKRAKAIYEFSEKEVSVGTIVNLIYLINGKYKRINFSSDKVGVKDLQKLFISLSKLLDDNIIDVRNKQIGEKTSPKYDKIIYSYMLMAKTQSDTNKYVVTKQEAIEAAKIVKEQLNNIRDGKADNYSKTALKHYKLYMSLKNRTGKDENAKILAGYPYAFFRDYTSKNTIMTGYLTKEQAKELDENYTETYSSALSGKIEQALNINLQAEIEEAIKSGEFGNKVPEYAERYNSSDASIANSKVSGNRETTRRVIDSGGREVTSYSERVNTPTTSVTRESYTVTPTTNVVEESYVAEPITEGTTKKAETTTKKSETTTKREESTKNNTVTTTTTPSTKKNEEVLDEGGDVVFEGSEDELEEFLKGQRYVDADKTNSYVKTK